MMATTEASSDYVGRAVAREEDAKLLAGQGCYVDNLSVPGMVWIAIVAPRSLRRGRRGRKRDQPNGRRQSGPRWDRSGCRLGLYEEAVYDEPSNLARGWMTGYLVPTTAEVPSFELDHLAAPSPTNPTGVNRVGGIRTLASTAAIVNAVVDALQLFGVEDVKMPASPERVWRAIHGGGQ